MADRDTIHEVAELLFRAAVERDNRYATRYHSQLDEATQVKYSTVTVPIARLPAQLAMRVDASVERNVIAYLADLDLICKITDDTIFGRAFTLGLPGELIGMSWDEVLRQLGLSGGDAE